MMMSLDQRRERFCTARVGQSDDAFAAATVAGFDTVVLLAVRRALAAVCQVPAEMVHASDAPRDLCEIMGEGGDLSEFVFALEDVLAGQGLRLTRDIDDLPLFGGWRFFFWGDEGHKTVGEWALAVVAMLSEEELILPIQ